MVAYIITLVGSLPPTGLHSLPIPLLDTRLGNFEAPMDSTQPCKGCLLKIRPVVVICHLQFIARITLMNWPKKLLASETQVGTWIL